MDKPDVDVIEGLSPAISIEQKATSHNPRSTVGTITEIHDYLRLLFARAGTPHCPDHGLPLRAQSVSQMVDAVLALPEETKLMVLAPVVRDRRGEFVELFESMQAQGYVRFRIDGRIVEAADDAGAGAEEDREARHRRGARPPEGAPRRPAAPGRELRGGAAHRRRPRWRWRWTPAPSICSRPGSPARSAATRWPSWSRGCSRSTRRWAPARAAAAWAMSMCSTPSGWWPSRRSVWRQRRDQGWDRRNAHTFSMLESVAAHYGFDLEDAFEDLAPEHRQVVLHGSGEEEIAFTYAAEGAGGKKRSVRRSHPFEGILPNMQRRYRETDLVGGARGTGALHVEQVLPGLRRLAAAARGAPCAAGRCRRPARARHLPGRACDAGRVPALFRQLRLQGAKAEIADRWCAEIARGCASSTMSA